jgi:hypothetical protein
MPFVKHVMYTEGTRLGKKSPAAVSSLPAGRFLVAVEVGDQTRFGSRS